MSAGQEGASGPAHIPQGVAQQEGAAEATHRPSTTGISKDSLHTPAAAARQLRPVRSLRFHLKGSELPDASSGRANSSTPISAASQGAAAEKGGLAKLARRSILGNLPSTRAPAPAAPMAPGGVSTVGMAGGHSQRMQLQCCFFVEIWTALDTSHDVISYISAVNPAQAYLPCALDPCNLSSALQVFLVHPASHQPAACTCASQDTQGVCPVRHGQPQCTWWVHCFPPAEYMHSSSDMLYAPCPG
jgi:hypothetical protein